MHHLDPLEGSCLKGWEGEGGLWIRGSRVQQDEGGFERLSRKRHLDPRTQVQDGKYALSNGPVLTAAWVLSCKAKSEHSGKE